MRESRKYFEDDTSMFHTVFGLKSIKKLMGQQTKIHRQILWWGEVRCHLKLEVKLEVKLEFFK